MHARFCGRNHGGVLAALLASLTFPVLARAGVGSAVYTWTNTGTGFFSDTANWTPVPPAGGPAVLDSTLFNANTSPIVMFNTDPLNMNLSVGVGNVSFQTSAVTHSYTLSANTSLTQGSLSLSGLNSLATFSLATGDVSVQNGGILNVQAFSSLTTTTLHVANGIGAASQVTVTSAPLTVSGATSIGQAGGAGTLAFHTNAVGTLAAIDLTNTATANSSSTLTVDGGSDVTASGNITFGSGSQAGQTTTVLVSGSGSTFTQTGSTTLSVGAGANSVSNLTVTEGGVFSTGTGAITVNATGAIKMEGGTAFGTFNANGDITLNGGKLQHNNPNATFNLAAGKNVTANNNAEVKFSAGYNIGNGSTFTINSGSALTSTQYIDVGNGSTGTLIVDNATMTLQNLPLWGAGGGTANVTLRNNAVATINHNLGVASSPVAGSNATLLVQDGATLSVKNLAVANQGGNATASITVTGANAAISLQTTFFLLLGSSSGTGTATLNVNNNGAFNTGTSISSINQNGAVNINGGTFNLNGNFNIIAGGSMKLGGASNAWDGTFDLKNHKLVYKNSAATKAAILDRLQNQVNFGKTNPDGIISTGLPANTAIAVIDNGALATPFTTFGGIPGLDNNSIMVAPELIGDANIDGVVNFTDFVRLSNNFGQANTGWAGADFNGDGTTNFTDFVQLSNHFGQTFGSPSMVVGPDEFAAFEAASAAFVAAVPEPATLLLQVVGATALLARRSRRSSGERSKRSARRG